MSDENEPDKPLASDIGVDPVDPPAPASSEPVGDISLDAALSAAAKKPTARNLNKDEIKKYIQYAFGGAGILLCLLMLYQCQAKEGSMAYGICSTFLELNTTYPHTLRYISLEGSRTAVRIYYTDVDAFGEFKQEMIECKFGPDPDMGMRLTEILRNRKPIDAKIVNDFNKTLPIVKASDPYRLTPPDWKNQLLME